MQVTTPALGGVAGLLADPRMYKDKQASDRIICDARAATCFTMLLSES